MQCSNIWMRLLAEGLVPASATFHKVGTCVSCTLPSCTTCWIHKSFPDTCFNRPGPWRMATCLAEEESTNRWCSTWQSSEKFNATTQVDSIAKCRNHGVQLTLTWAQAHHTLSSAACKKKSTIQCMNPTACRSSVLFVSTPVWITKCFNHPKSLRALPFSLTSNWLFQNHAKVTCCFQITNHLSKPRDCCQSWTAHCTAEFLDNKK